MKKIISLCTLVFISLTCYSFQSETTEHDPVVIYYQQTIQYSGSQPAQFKRSIAVSTSSTTPWKLHFESDTLLDTMTSPSSSIYYQKQGSVFHYIIEPAQLPSEHVELLFQEEISADSIRMEQDGKLHPVQYLQFETTRKEQPLPDLESLLRFSLVLQDLSPDKDCWCEKEDQQRSPSPSGQGIKQQIQREVRNLIPEQQSSRTILGESLFITTHLAREPSEDRDPFPQSDPIPASKNQYICLENQCPKGRQSMQSGGDNNSGQQPPPGGGNNYSYCPNFSCFTYNNSGGAGSQGDNASSGSGDHPPPGHRTGPMGTASLTYTLAKNRHSIAMAVGGFAGVLMQEAVIWFICAAPSQRKEGEGWWDCVTRVSEAGSRIISGVLGAGAGLAILGCANNKKCYCRRNRNTEQTP